MHWSICDTIDLEKYKQDDKCLPLQLMLPGDNQGHVWSVSVMSGGVPYDLTGKTVQAFFTRADGNTVVVAGTATGNAAIVTLPRDVYLVRGSLRGVVRIGDSVSSTSDPVTTLIVRTFYVQEGVGSSLIDPSDSFPTVSGLAEDLATLEGTVTAQGTALTALTNQVNGDGQWTELAAATGFDNAVSAYDVTGYPIAYRVENGNHVYLRANVGKGQSVSVTLPVQINSALVPENLRPGKQLHTIGCCNNSTSFARAYIANDGKIYLYSALGTSEGTINELLWTSLQWDWFIQRS